MQSIWVTINTEERVRQLIPKEPEGLDILKKCLEKKKGVLFLTAHYGNWEIMGLYHGLLGICPLSSIVRKLDNPYLDNFATKMRTATGNQIFYRDDSLLKIVRELKNNHSVAVMMDQNTARGSIFVNFFGLKASTPRALARLSYRLGTPVIPLFSYPTSTGTYSIKYGPELIFEKFNLDKTLLNAVSSDEMNWIAKRPKNSSLNTSLANSVLDKKSQSIEQSLNQFFDEINSNDFNNNNSNN